MKKHKKIVSIVAIIYILIMVYLLFLMRIGGIEEASGLTFLQHFKQYTNFIPFRSINRYGSALLIGTHGVSIAVINLIGNIVVFIPMGIFLPIYFDKAKKLLGIVIITIITVLSVEMIQFFTYTGTFDIDDIILNLIGSIMGFVIWEIWNKK
jgi:glycopeptide antibiotics resistance protein